MDNKLKNFGTNAEILNALKTDLTISLYSQKDKELFPDVFRACDALFERCKAEKTWGAHIEPPQSIINRLFPESTDRGAPCTKYADALVAAKSQGKVVGFVMPRRLIGGFGIDSMAIDPKFDGRGIEDEIMDFVVENSRGVSDLTAIYNQKNNEQLHRLCCAFGFENKAKFWHGGEVYAQTLLDEREQKSGAIMAAIEESHAFWRATGKWEKQDTEEKEIQ